MTQKLFILAAGGTGGHLFPAQATAQELLKAGHRVVLMTDPRFAAFAKGFEGVEVHSLPMGKIGGGIKGKVMGAAGVLRSILAALALLKRMSPSAVIGFGGYPSFPTMAAAICLKLPTMIHEQNKLAGKANRLLARGVRKIAATFPETLGLAEKDKTKIVVVGNPVRPAILELNARGYEAPQDKINLLIFGGSQGARIFSEVVPEAITRLPENLRTKLRIAQQARAEDGSAVVKKYSDLRIIADVRPFFEDMPQQLAKAHLVICRAGASTIAEMTVAGKPAIYAPYPYAADDHQRHNAEYIMQHGAGWLLPDKEFTVEALEKKLETLFTQTELLKTAANNASALALPDAGVRLAGMAQALAA